MTIDNAKKGLQMSTVRPLIYMIDDNDTVLWMFQEFLKSTGAEFRSYTSASAFLEMYRPGPYECLICDLRMPEINGLEVQRQLLDKGDNLPIIFVSGYPEVHSAVEAIKKGAFDFLQKPVSGHLLLEKVQNALAHNREIHAKRVAARARQAQLDQLTPKERQITELVVIGKSSPQIAEALLISVRTVENHRARIMEKLNTGTVVELVRLFL